MSDDSRASRPGGPGGPGIGDATRRLLDSLAAYFQARLQLIRLESREAASTLGTRALLFVFAAGLLLVAYLAAFTAGIALLSQEFEISWPHLTLGLAGLHFIGGLILLALAKRRLGRDFFEHTLREFDKDREWLKPEKTDHETTEPKP